MPVERLSREEVIKSYAVAYPKSRSRSRSRSRSSSTSRTRVALTVQVNSHRLLRTINVESDDESLCEDGSKTAGNSALSANLQKLNLSGGGEGNSECIEVPFVDVSLDTSMPKDYMKDDVLNIIQTLRIPKWHTKNSQKTLLQPKKLKIIQVAGAMTNVIYKLEYPKLPSLLLRVFGPNNDSIIDRDYELQVLARLSLQNIGPSLFGCFTNGRFEQFLENSKSLTKSEIRDWTTSQRIARRMKELHTGVPLLHSEKTSGAICLNKVNRWLDKAEAIGSEWLSNDENVQKFLLAPNWKAFREAVSAYQNWLDDDNTQNVAEKLVFCHNDTQYGNLLLSAPVEEVQSVTPTPTERSGASSSVTSLFPSSSNISLDKIIYPSNEETVQDTKLIVIDFEYAGPNPAAYDLANHLSEWMHDYNCDEPHKCTYSQFPSKEQSLNFLYSYVSHLRGGAKISIDEEVKQHYNAIMKWRACVHLFWGVWSLLKCGELESNQNSEIVKEEQAPNGNKYIIKTENLSDEDFSPDDEPENEISNGVSCDSFDYVGFGRDKLRLFWSDIMAHGIVEPKSNSFVPAQKLLDVAFL